VLVAVRNVHGLGVDSTIDLDGCPEDPLPAEVVVQRGPVPEALPDPDVEGVCFQTKPRVSLLSTPAGRYLIEDGTSITVDRDYRPQQTGEAHCLLESAFPILLHQRGVLPLHAAAVDVDGEAILFLGPSATGKSAIASWLVRRGSCLVSDEVCAVFDAGTRGPSVAVGPARIGVWPDTVELLDIPLDELRPIRDGLDKRIWLRSPLPAGERGVRRLYIFSVHHHDEVRLEPLRGTAKLEAVFSQVHQPAVALGSGCLPEVFEACVALARRLPVIRVSGPRDPSRPRELLRIADTLQRDLES
jgi:hypothetical protein